MCLQLKIDLGLETGYYMQDKQLHSINTSIVDLYINIDIVMHSYIDA